MASPSRTSLADEVTGLLGRPAPRPGLPWTVAKYAQTLDGRIATVSGDSQWISSPEERRFTHAVRAHCDGILVGIGTVLADDPHLTVREVPGRSPVRAILDSALRTPVTARVLDTAAPTVILSTENASVRRGHALREAGAQVVRVACDRDGRTDLETGLRALRAHGLESLMVEGGTAVLTALLRSRFVDRVVVSLAPIIMGKGLEAVGDLGVRRLSDALRLKDLSTVRMGPDLVWAGTPDHPRPA
ncbi:RibD family protein [Streptomyces sp. NBC_00872]|uniref:RibD family protein n=1 Tax=Streptomyces sp. NBC_00872 TaxID=2903686 RepID=UPI00386E0F20|nr:dihydrofolate reductase family protein [Streptomyces sp. NBC_00872]